METTQTTSKSTLVSRSGPIEVSNLQRLLWICNTFYYQILAIVSVVLLWICFEQDRGKLYTTHLVLSTAAYVPLMAAAIILFSEDNVIALYIPRTKRNTIHGVLLAISTVAASIGMSAEIYGKSENGRKHFTSMHAKLGLASWILIFVCVVFGLVAANTRTFSAYIRPVLAKLVHNLLGLAAFALGVASLWKMLDRLRGDLSDSAFVGLEWCLVFVTVWSGLAALKSLYEQVKGVFS